MKSMQEETTHVGPSSPATPPAVQETPTLQETPMAQEVPTVSETPSETPKETPATETGSTVQESETGEVHYCRCSILYRKKHEPDANAPQLSAESEPTPVDNSAALA